MRSVHSVKCKPTAAFHQSTANSTLLRTFQGLESQRQGQGLISLLSIPFGLCVLTAFTVCNVALNRPSFQSSTLQQQDATGVMVSYGAHLGTTGITVSKETSRDMVPGLYRYRNWPLQVSYLATTGIIRERYRYHTWSQ